MGVGSRAFPVCAALLLTLAVPSTGRAADAAAPQPVGVKAPQKYTIGFCRASTCSSRLSRIRAGPPSPSPVRATSTTRGSAADVSVRAGFEFQRWLGSRNLQLLVEYFRGHSPNGQFYTDYIDYLGLGMHFNF